MGKKQIDAAARYDRAANYAPAEALGLVKALAHAGFDETVEAAFNLGIDARQADQIVRGTVTLPHGTGKTVRVLVFAEGEKARDAQAAGADIVGGAELAQAITAGQQALDWDVTIAVPVDDERGGQAGPAARPPGPDAQPQGGHGQRRHRPDGAGVPGRPGGVPQRPVRQRARGAGQGVLRR